MEKLLLLRLSFLSDRVGHVEVESQGPYTHFTAWDCQPVGAFCAPLCVDAHFDQCRLYEYFSLFIIMIICMIIKWGLGWRSD
jgi:hypothetical protein